MRAAPLCGVVCLLLLFALGASATTVSANLKNLGIANVTSQTFVRFELKNFGPNLPRVSGTNVIVSPIQDFTPDGSGNISGSIQGNDTITPAGTFYRVCIWNKGTQFRCADYNITGASFDLNSAAPITTVPVVSPPTGDGTYQRLDGGNTATGNYVPNAAGINLGAVGAEWDAFLLGGTWGKVRVVGGAGSEFATIQAAIDDGPGGKVFVPEGTHAISASLLIPSNTYLVGAGVNKTIIRLANASDVHAVQNSDTVGGNSNIRIEDITFDFNGQNQTADTHGIRFEKVTDVRLANLELKDAFHHNLVGIEVVVGDETSNNWFLSKIKTTGAGRGDTIDGDGIRMTGSSARWHLSDITALDNSHHGVHFNGEFNEGKGIYASGNDTADIYMSNAAFTVSDTKLTNFETGGDITAGQTGLLIEDADNVTVSTGIVRGSAQDGVRVNTVGTPNRITISNVQAIANGRHGFFLQGDNVVLSPCIAQGNTNSGINLTTGDNVIVVACRSTGNDIGIRVDSGVTNFTLAANIATGNTTSQISDASGSVTKTLIGNEGVADVLGTETNIKRLKASQATAHVAGDYALGGNWGTTPSISAVAATDMGGSVDVTSGTGTPGANPTLTLTFKDGTFTTAPAIVASRGENNGPAGAWAVTSATATAAVFTLQVTPAVSTVYRLRFVVMGR